ncbi:phage baseplate assembly protein V [Geodermatophilus sp. SYSU D00691]
MTDRFYGKYIGTVEANDDPKHLCRVKAKVPEVLGDETTGWCLPSVPYGGPKVGLAAVPPTGALVFVEWPAGDVTRTPVWSGAVWSDGQGVPDAGPAAIRLITPAGHKVELVDEPTDDRALRLTSASGATLVMDKNGVLVTFKSQKVAVTASSITLNGGALEVT